MVNFLILFDARETNNWETSEQGLLSPKIDWNSFSQVLLNISNFH